MKYYNTKHTKIVKQIVNLLKAMKKYNSMDYTWEIWIPVINK